MSSIGYATLKPFLKDEKIYHGKDVEYLDTRWTTVLGVTENKVYKLRLQTNYKGRDIWHQAFHDLIREYGFSLDQKKMGQSLLASWDTEWGSVVLNRKIIEGETIVDITFTEDLPFRKLYNAAIEGSSDKIIPETPGQPQPSVDSLIAALKDDPIPNIRMNAVKNLGKIKDKRAVEPLCEALEDKSLNVRIQVVYALGALGEIDDRAIECLITALKDKDVGYTAGDSLIKMGGPAVRALTEALKDPDIKERVVDLLGSIGKGATPRGEPIKTKGDVIELLCSALKDESAGVRERAARELGEIKDSHAIEPLSAALNDSDENVRRLAAGALEKIGKPAVEALIAVLNDPVDEVQIYATLALAKIGDPALEPLIVALKDQNPNVRYRAAKALGAMKDFRAVEALIGAMKNNWGLPSQEAGRALLNITGEHFGNRPEEWQKWWDQVKEKYLEKVKH